MLPLCPHLTFAKPYHQTAQPQNLAVGMKLWGCVLEVAPEGLTVSLPHGLRGTVAPEEVGDTYSAVLCAVCIVMFCVLCAVLFAVCLIR
jgi:hypothetical protein